MRVTNILPILPMTVVALTMTGCVAMGVTAADYHVQVNAADYQKTIDNPYFPLVPGTRLTYIEKAGGEVRENVIYVTHDIKMIQGVPCVVVHDTVTRDGKLLEDTYDWFTQHKDGTVWYFGENTKEYKPDGTADTQGSWEAGVDGAQPGIIMTGHPAPGEPYFQEYYRGQAEDMGQIVALNDSVTVPAGSYTGVIRTKEWSLLESGGEIKLYARGVGVVRTEASDGEVATLQSITHE